MGGLFRLLLIAGLVWLALSTVRRLLSGSAPARRPRRELDGEAMVKDPNCGRFILQRTAVTASFRGRTLFFCGPECRDKYRRVA